MQELASATTWTIEEASLQPTSATEAVKIQYAQGPETFTLVSVKTR